jgi:cytochrome P450
MAAPETTSSPLQDADVAPGLARGAASANGPVPPGPRGKPVFGSAFDFQRDALTAMVDGWRKYGDVVRFSGPGSFFPLWLFTHPDHIGYVLQENFANFRRPDILNERFGAVVGNGLVTTDGEIWRRQRKMAQPAFHKENINALAGKMTDTIEETLERWHGHAERGEEIELQSEMFHMVLTILSRCLFGADLKRDVETIEASVEVQAKYLNDRIASPVNIPERLPIPSNRRFLHARESLHEVVDRMIAERKRSGESTGDLLSTLIDARDEDTGQPMSDEQLRDEVKTFLIAGHDTTAITLSWCLTLLSQHPAAERRLRDELAEVLGGRTPTAEDVPNLVYTKQVIQETLRHYPPLFILARMPIEDDEIGGYRVPARTTMIFCPYATHRHPDFWDNPEGFDPGRFTEEAEKSRHRYSYFPFSGGPRGCVGFPFAMIEMHLVLATILQRFRLSLAPGYPVEHESAISLRQKYGAQMMLEPVQAAA